MKWAQENSAGQHLRSACSARDASWAVRVLLIGSGSLGPCPSPCAAVPPASLWEASASSPLPAEFNFAHQENPAVLYRKPLCQGGRIKPLPRQPVAESQEVSMATKLLLLQMFSTALPVLSFAALP